MESTVTLVPAESERIVPASPSAAPFRARRQRYSYLLAPLCALGDLLVVNGCFLLAYHEKFGLNTPLLSTPYANLYWFFNAAWVLSLLLLKPYTVSRISFTLPTLLTSLVRMTGLHMALVAVFWVFTKASAYYSREQLAMTYLLFVLAGSAWRTVTLSALYHFRIKGYNNRRFVIVGYGSLSSSIRQFYQMHPEMGYHFAGYFDRLNAFNAHELRGDYEELNAYVYENGIDSIYCCLPYLEAGQLKEILTFSEEVGCQVKLIVDFKSFLSRTVSVEYHDLQPVISISSRLMNDLRVNVYKRLFDIAFALLVLVLGAPVFLLLAVLTKLTSPGPVLYSQERIGRWGKPFRIYKFRSMYPGSEALGPALSLGGTDPRITPWGRIMRRTRLDELPQFFNVLRGDMSIVGPRPARQHFINQIIQKSPEYKVLLTVKPGITSIGQIKFGYAENVEEMIQRLKYDLLYLNRVSFLYDLWLISQTLWVMVQGKGK